MTRSMDLVTISETLVTEERKPYIKTLSNCLVLSKSICKFKTIHNKNLHRNFKKILTFIRKHKRYRRVKTIPNNMASQVHPGTGIKSH